MTDQELMALMLQFDPQTKRIPPGVRAIADAVLAEAQKQIRKEQIYCSQQFARIKELEAEVAGYQLCAAEKQAEIDALTARIATLEQQRQQDMERLDHLEVVRARSIRRGFQWDSWKYYAVQSDQTIRQQIDAERDPHHD